MIDVIGGEEFIDGSKILLIEHFLIETPYQDLVLFYRHKMFSFLCIASFTKDIRVDMQGVEIFGSRIAPSRSFSFIVAWQDEMPLPL